MTSTDTDAKRTAPVPVGPKMKVSERIPLLVAYLADHRQTTRQEIATALNCSPGVARYTLVDAKDALAEAGLAAADDKGKITVTSAGRRPRKAPAK